MKKTIYSIVLAITLIASTVRIYAADLEEMPSNLEVMTHTEINEFSRSVIESVILNDKSYMAEYVDCFTNESLNKIYGLVVNNDINGSIQSIVADWVYPKYSSTGDSVIMINVKLQSNVYNELYLFELHINADGKIYGYNVWAY